MVIFAEEVETKKNPYDEQVEKLYQHADVISRLLDVVPCGAVNCGSCPFRIWSEDDYDWGCMTDTIRERVVEWKDEQDE